MSSLLVGSGGGAFATEVVAIAAEDGVYSVIVGVCASGAQVCGFDYVVQWKGGW